MLRPMALAMIVLLGACGSQESTARAAENLTVLEAPPYPPVERLGPEPAAQTLESRRWLFERRIEEQKLALLRRIKREEMGNFGGVEWRWQEGSQNGGLGELTGIVYFLREPEKRLARYTKNPLFKPAKAGFSRNEQDLVVRQWAERIGREVASEGFYNIQVPTLDVALTRAEFQQLARKEGWRLPTNLKVRLNPLAEPDLPALPAELRPLIRAFPQQPRIGGPVPDIATYDAIVLRKGCFFIDAPGQDDPLVEFPLGIGVYRDGDGYLAFRPRYAADKRRLGRVGTRLQLGYRTERPAPPELASACGARTMVSITSADQAAGYGSDWFSVKQYRERTGVSAAEAIRRANACLLAQEKTMADNRLRGGRQHPNQCAKLGLLSNPVAPPPPPPPPTPSQASPTAETFPLPPPKLLQPNRNGVCRFEERDPSERPRELIQTNHGSNMIFWADRGAVLWDHPNGFTDEGMVIPGKRIVAARKGMKDLWISPARDDDIMLYSGTDRFECRIRGEG